MTRERYRRDSARYTKIQLLTRKINELSKAITELNALVNNIVVDDLCIQSIVREVFGEFNITNKKTGSLTRKTTTVMARHAYRFLSYNYTDKTLTEIGVVSGSKAISSHSVVMSSIDVAKDLINTDSDFSGKIDICISKIQWIAENHK